MGRGVLRRCDECEMHGKRPIQNDRYVVPGCGKRECTREEKKSRKTNEKAGQSAMRATNM